MAIICATDFSEYARHAEDAAAALAGRWGLPLWLLHVQEPEVEVMTHAAQAQVSAMLKDRLSGIANRLQPLVGAKPIELAVERGRPAAVVKAFARSHGGTLLVVGSAGHGYQPLARLGGTSERVASQAELPVLVVREGDTFKEWAAGRPFRVLLGLDEGVASASALRLVTRLREAGPLDVVVGRVYYASDAHHHYGVAGPQPQYTDPDRAVEPLIERDLKRLVPSLPGSGEVLYRAKLGVGRVADHLLELAEAERCSLVVVGMRRHAGVARMWSVSSAALHQARMAVAVVPDDGLGAGNLAPRPRLRRVLVPTDFSELGNAAVPWAYAVVERGGEVVLAHVTPGEGVADQLAGLYSPALPVPHASPRVEAEVAARLRALTPQAAGERGVLTRTEVVRANDPAKAVLVLSEQLGVDAIVISSHGRSGLTRVVRGSVAEVILRGATRPVLVVRGPG